MNNLRPSSLDDIVGQEEVVSRLKISVSGANKRGEAIPHSLFDGPPGLGKTTLACALADARSVKIQIANGGNLGTVKSILPYLMKLEENDILFIDEVHRLPVKVEEFLYPVMEDFRLDDSDSDISIPAFTMVGATTEAGSLSRPFYTRFIYKYELQTYNEQDLAKIIEKSAAKLNLTIEKRAAINLAKRSRGTPRIANNLILWVRDYVDSKGARSVSDESVEKACGLVGVDSQGVTTQDRKYLDILRKYGRPMGLATLVDSTNLDADTIRHIIEPFLLRCGLIQRTPKGRIAV